MSGLVLRRGLLAPVLLAAIAGRAAAQQAGKTARVGVLTPQSREASASRWAGIADRARRCPNAAIPAETWGTGDAVVAQRCGG